MSLLRRVANRVRREALWLRTALRYSQIERQTMAAERKSHLAVVVHVYYPEVWTEISQRLELLENYDLFVTVSDSAHRASSQISSFKPDSTILMVPNLGRDVLPFIRVARALQRIGYSSVLKLHTKRSVHADDGAEFMTACLTELLPSRDQIEAIRDLVTEGRAAIVGPASRYYPLAIHAWINRADLYRFTQKFRTADLEKLARFSDWGFFAGTMFWVHLPSIGDCLDVPVRWFAREEGQIDGTMAHALERLFCVVPEFDHRPIATTGPAGIQELAYDDYSWPTWALRRPELE